jgi:hypothetical protein
MEERTKLINRTIQYIAERKCISIDDVTDEMIMLELADIVVKNCSIPNVVEQSEKLFCHHEGKYTLKSDGNCCKCHLPPKPQAK